MYKRQKTLYAAIDACLKNSKNSTEKLAEAQTRWHNNALFWYAKLLFLCNQQQYDHAVSFMLSLPKTEGALLFPAIWWRKQKSLFLDLLDLGRPDLAYKLMAQPLNGALYARSLAHFYAGWCALRFLHHKDWALKHFKAMLPLAQNNLSKARTYYWLGRNYEALQQNKTAFIFYKKAAGYETNYYGQIAAVKLNRKNLLHNYIPHPSKTERNKFTALPLVQAINRLNQVGYGERAGLLYRYLMTQLNTPESLTLLAQLAQKQGDHYSGLKIGKNAFLRGLRVGLLSFPLGALPPFKHPLTQKEKAFAYAVARQESEFKADAVSRAGALGLLQLMPKTARNVAQKHGVLYCYHCLTDDPAYNAFLGANLLKELLEQFKGSYILTLIAYNAGPRRANQWIQDHGDPRSKPIECVIDWVERIPIEETRNYVCLLYTSPSPRD